MTPEQIDHVRKSFAAVAPIAPQAAAMFYDRLFALDPALRGLFKRDMRDQGAKLMQVLGTAIAGLDNVSALVPILHALGSRHRGYGVKARDYDTVGAALISTLEKGLGDSFTPTVRAAWLAAYTLLAETMQAGVTGSVRAAA